MILDLMMIAIIAASFGLVGLLVRWCHNQVDKQE